MKLATNIPRVSVRSGKAFQSQRSKVKEGDDGVCVCRFGFKTEDRRSGE